MDDRRFDALTRAFARGTSRRTAIKGLFGGVVGGVAVATRLNPAGAQSCTPETVLDDCPLPDACTTATCLNGTCDYDGGCPPGSCTECDNATGQCIAIICELGEECVGGVCQSICDEGWLWCGGQICAPQCCTVDDCVAAGDTFCSSVICNIEGLCEVIAECTDGQQCCGQGTEGAHCAYCCDSGDCASAPCGICNAQGVCEYDECCDSYDCQTPCSHCSDGVCYGDCSQSQECCRDECVAIGTCCDGFGESCGFDEVAAGDGQLSCCDGLLCCDTGKGDHACYECCGDWNCDKGLVCAGGECVQCGDDSHCGKGEICCWGACVYGECCSAVPVDGVAAGGLDEVHACGPCEACYDNWCRSTCDDWEVCCETEPEYFACVHENEGCCGLAGDWCDAISAADGLNGSCCDGLNCCYDDKTKNAWCAECCGNWDCPEGWYCCGGTCQPECCDDKDCEWGVCVDGYCVECRDDWGCDGKKGEICCDGSCQHWECCGYGDEDHCGDCGWCGENYTCYALAEFGEHCEVLMAADGSPEGNCCHGLVCCEWDKKNFCAECCGDWDCPEGCACDHGVCSCHCGSDKDCAPGTCCCKSGACSHDCCPKPPKPPKPAPKPDQPVTTLPATGSGDTATSSGLLGAAAIGAAALLAARKLRETPEVSTEE
jgi:LPXTG-motif cell wall-anchored protein